MKCASIRLIQIQSACASVDDGLSGSTKYCYKLVLESERKEAVSAEGRVLWYVEVSREAVRKWKTPG